ncbi:MAG TPA: hypothetical protein VEL09_11245 [Burkholderiales bacterium]|nr:hypothetical protein [Burkholderiales bacterium]
MTTARHPRPPESPSPNNGARAKAASFHAGEGGIVPVGGVVANAAAALAPRLEAGL